MPNGQIQNPPGTGRRSRQRMAQMGGYNNNFNNPWGYGMSQPFMNNTQLIGPVDVPPSYENAVGPVLMQGPQVGDQWGTNFPNWQTREQVRKRVEVIVSNAGVPTTIPAQAEGGEPIQTGRYAGWRTWGDRQITELMASYTSVEIQEMTVKVEPLGGNDSVANLYIMVAGESQSTPEVLRDQTGRLLFRGREMTKSFKPDLSRLSRNFKNQDGKERILVRMWWDHVEGEPEFSVVLQYNLMCRN